MKLIVRNLFALAFTVLLLTVSVRTAALAQSRQPMSQKEVIGLLTNDVPPDRVASLARQFGISFPVTPEAERVLRDVGADDSLIETLKEVSPKATEAPATETPAAPAPAPAPVSNPASLVVQSQPGGAQVYLDDSPMGTTGPDGREELRDLSPGLHRVRVSLESHRVFVQAVELKPGETTQVVAMLEALPSVLEVQTTPGHAFVYLDDAPQGLTSEEGRLRLPNLTAGGHRLRVNRRGYREFTKLVNLTAGKTVEIKAQLEPLKPAAAATPSQPPVLPSAQPPSPQPAPPNAPLPRYELARTLRGHDGWVRAVDFSPDGRTLVSASADHTIKLWNVAGGNLLRTLRGHSNAVRSVAFSPDGRLLASASQDTTIRLWDVATGKQVGTLGGHANPAWCVAFSPDGRLLASGGADKIVRLWSLRTGSSIRSLSGHGGIVYSVAFSPDGRLLASGSEDNTIKLWDVATGRELRTLRGHSKAVWAVAFSPDGKSLASGSWDNTIKLWNVSTGAEIRTLTGHGDSVDAVAFSPDGRVLASASSDKTIRIWNVATGKEIRTLTGHTDSVVALTFSSDGTLASASKDETIKLWRAD